MKKITLGLMIVFALQFVSLWHVYGKEEIEKLVSVSNSVKVISGSSKIKYNKMINKANSVNMADLDVTEKNKK